MTGDGTGEPELAVDQELGHAGCAAWADEGAAGAGSVWKRGTLCPVHICSPDVEAASPSLWGGHRRKGGVVGRSGRRRPCDPRHVPHPKAASSSAADLRLVLLLVADGRLVGLPVLAGDVGVGVDGTLGGGHQGVGLQAHLGGELAGALGLALEAGDARAVLVAVVVLGRHGEVAGWVTLLW